MNQTTYAFNEVKLSLADIAGAGYAEAACAARAALTGDERSELSKLAMQPVEFLPSAFLARQAALLAQVGSKICPVLAHSPLGASTRDFNAHTKTAAAPLSAVGCFRVGEDGRVYLTAKSEHYHTSLGHSFPGYRLLDVARSLGIPNATHNNTRGFLTRLLEEKLIRAANGSGADLDAVLASTEPTVLNRVLNLETGSLAAEAALKMILSTFYRSQRTMEAPRYAKRIPVVLVLGNDEAGLEANYHGTTVLTQIMRGMWPELRTLLESQTLKVAAVRPNNLDDLEEAFIAYEKPPCKIAAFFHEIVMMNYGGRLLSPEFMHRAHELCAKSDVPVVVDEIQSGAWSPELLLYREYKLKPSFVAIGKGFPGGEYPASRLIFSAAYDNLTQFGALVTNGQEELASLAYLVTMRWIQENADVVGKLGNYYESAVREIAANHQDLVSHIDGLRHMTTMSFHTLDAANAFVRYLSKEGLDISAQTYKKDCPPAVLTKLPLIANVEVIDFVTGKMRDALLQISEMNRD